MTERRLRSDAWDDKDSAYPPLTRQEAEAFRRHHPQVSAWRVVGVQVLVGGVVAALAWLISGDRAVVGSALYGAGVVVVPAALMARGATSGLSRASPAAGAVSFMSWAVVKIGVSLLMLASAPRIVQPLSWPALLVAMVLCMKVYWFALLWRGRRPKKNAA